MATATVENGAVLLYPVNTKSIIIAGMGKQGRDSCGRVTWKGVCEHSNAESQGKHDSVLKHERCYRLSCPVCYTQGVARAVSRALPRLRAAKILYKIKHKARHVVFSPPDGSFDDLTGGGWDALWKELYSLLKEHSGGITGGCGVLHPYRISAAGKAEYAREKRDLSLWRWLQSQGETGYFDKSPHIHTMLYGWLVPAAEFFEKTGWVYKVIEDDHPGGDHMERALSYMISHAGLLVENFEDDYGDDKQQSRKQAIRWFGALYPGALVYDGKKVVVKSEVVCSHCNGTLFKHFCDDHQAALDPIRDFDGSRVPVMDVTVTYHYRLKKKKTRVMKLGDFG